MNHYFRNKTDLILTWFLLLALNKLFLVWRFTLFVSLITELLTVLHLGLL